MPHFVILTHDWPHTHWDLMLEKEASLRTWRLERAADTPGPIRAESLPDHRMIYLEYEGPISGERGRVTRWDAGDYTLVVEADGHVEFEFRGERLSGHATLRQLHAGTAWEFTLTPTAVFD